MSLIVFPSPAELAIFGGAGALLSALLGVACGHLKLRRGVATNYTRKIFHFGIFTTAMMLQAGWGLVAVNAYAIGCVAVILFGVARGRGNPIFEGMARERDEPHRAFFVVVPLITTALGGLASNWVAGHFALVGYLVTGWGDAIGEPAGRRFGRHPYRVLSLRKTPCIRTIEGSLAVGLAAFLASTLALALVFNVALPTALIRGGVIGALTIVVEAVSPHGSDNFTTMVAASCAAAWMA